MKKEKQSGGAICGGVINKSQFDSNPWAYMMCYYLPDDKFELYKIAKLVKDEETAKEIFDKYKISAI